MSPVCPLVLDVRVAHGFWGRFRGLMLTPGLPATQGLLITRCASVHTCFMRFPLDLIYLDDRGVVKRLVAGVKPWRLSVGGAGVTQVLEMAAGGIGRLGVRAGDRLAIPGAGPPA